MNQQEICDMKFQDLKKLCYQRMHVDMCDDTFHVILVYQNEHVMTTLV